MKKTAKKLESSILAREHELASLKVTGQNFITKSMEEYLWLKKSEFKIGG